MSTSAPASGPSPAVMGTYGRINVVFDRGEGSWLIAKGGERYLDFGSGIAVNTLCQRTCSPLGFPQVSPGRQSDKGSTYARLCQPAQSMLRQGVDAHVQVY